MHVCLFSDGKTRQFSSSALTPKPSSSSSVSSKENGGTNGNSLSPFSLSGTALETQRMETYLNFLYDTEKMKVLVKVYWQGSVSVCYPQTLWLAIPFDVGNAIVLSYANIVIRYDIRCNDIWEIINVFLESIFPFLASHRIKAVTTATSSQNVASFTACIISEKWKMTTCPSLDSPVFSTFRLKFLSHKLSWLS